MTETQKQSQRAKKTLRRAVFDALERKQRLGQYAVICRNGRPVRIQPEHMPGQGNR